MTRNRKPSRREAETPLYRLTQLLVEAHVRAYVRDNPHHDNPEWRAAQPLRLAAYRKVADELLRLGVRLPG